MPMPKKSLVLAAFLLAASCASAQSQDVQHYTKPNAGVATLKLDNGGTAFRINSSRGQNACMLEGKAEPVSKDRYAYTSADAGDACVAVLTFKGNKLQVTTKDCDGRCGLNAADTMDGSYTIQR